MAQQHGRNTQKGFGTTLELAFKRLLLQSPESGGSGHSLCPPRGLEVGAHPGLSSHVLSDQQT